MFLQKLYVRIWLAVVLAVAVLTLLVGWAWRLAAEPPLREVVLRNEAGQIIGTGQARGIRSPGAGPRSPPVDDAGDRASALAPAPHGQYGNGPEFMVRMSDGQTLHMHLPRRASSFWNHAPFGFFWVLGLVAVAVALATYPIIRTLTRRLERLQDGVEQWGAGDLSIRIPETGQDEVAFLAKRFNIAAARIEALVKAQKSLLANASHELRSPLTRIRMGLELMGESSPLPGAEALAPSKPALGFKREIERNIAELDQLIEEILLASRLDASESDLGTVESVDLIGLAAEECARVDADLDVQVNGSALLANGVTKLLRRAVRNLLENARRHAAGEITLTLSQTDNQAVIRVCDRGPGVPPALNERIFEPFYRLPGATERDGGVGLGLALVKSIASRHGGSVVCENRPMGGTCFVLKLPLAVARKA